MSNASAMKWLYAVAAGVLLLYAIDAGRTFHNDYSERVSLIASARAQSGIDPTKVAGFSELDRDFRTRSSSPVQRVIVQYSVASTSDSASTLDARGMVAAAPLRTEQEKLNRGRDSVQRQARSSGVQVSEDLTNLPLAVLEVTQEQLEQLARSGLIARVQRDRVYDLTLDASAPKIQAPQAHRLGALGKGQTVVIMDTGVESAHPFFERDQIIAEACFSSKSFVHGSESLCPDGKSFSNQPGSAQPCKDGLGCDHGTHVAGIAAGRLGVAPKAKIVAIQIFSKFGLNVGSFQSDQIRALQYVLERAKDLNVSAINMSIGRGIGSQGVSKPCDTDEIHGILSTLIEDLSKEGVATIIASGNDKYIDGVGEPACISAAVTVGSTTNDDKVSDFSDISPVVDLVAPGTEICSAIPGAKFGRKSGTSMATPQVTGAFAAIKSIVPSMGPSQILDALRATGATVKDQRPGGTHELKRINIAAAIASLTNSPISTKKESLSLPADWCRPLR